MIRRARLEDIPALISLTKTFYDEMSFDDIGCRFDNDVVEETYTIAVQMPDNFIFLTDDDLKGVFFCSIQDRTLFYKGIKFAQEIVWHSSPLLDSFERSRLMICLLKTALNILGDIPLYLSSDVREEFKNVGQWLSKKGAVKMCEYWVLKGAQNGVSRS